MRNRLLMKLRLVMMIHMVFKQNKIKRTLKGKLNLNETWRKNVPQDKEAARRKFKKPANKHPRSDEIIADGTGRADARLSATSYALPSPMGAMAGTLPGVVTGLAPIKGDDPDCALPSCGT